MKHRSNRVNYLSYSSRRKKRGNRRERSQTLSKSRSPLPGHNQDSLSTMEIDVSQMLVDEVDEDHVQELVHESSSASSMIPFVDTSSWLGTAGELSLIRLPLTLFRMCSWWKSKVNESLEFAKDVVFPSRVYRRELYATQEQINILQEQIQRVREEMKEKNSTENHSAITSCPNCRCALGEVPHPLQLPPPPPPPQPVSSTLPSAPPPPLPPPPPAPPAPPSLMPPPPPPPPPPVVVPPKDWRQNLTKKKKGTTKNEKESCENAVISLADIKGVKLKKVNRTNKDTCENAVLSLADIKGVKLKKVSKTNKESCENAVISLADIKGVKLKKVSRTNKKYDVSPSGLPIGGPLVTISDLQSVNLKRSFKSPQLASPMNLRKRLSLEAMDFRTSLKRIGLPRSPGGTPFRTKPAESGVGLTPIMTRALKRKFRSIASPPSSPLSNHASPFTPPGLRL